MPLPISATILLVGVLVWLAWLLVVIGLLYSFGEHHDRERSRPNRELSGD